MEKEENSSSEIEKENLDDNSNQAENHPAEQIDKNPEDSASKNKLSPQDEIKDLKEKLIRAYAEMENQRRRFEKEKNDAFEYGGFAFAKEALNLIDNLVRSKISLENDEKLKNTDALKKTIEHLDIIYNDMISILKKNNIEEIKSIDQKLDPNLHQAMMEVEDEHKEPGIIVQEIQIGFTMKDRLLRPSLVAVSKKPAKNHKEPEEVKKDEKNQSKTDEK